MLASLKEDAAKNGSPLLVLAGPYEFLPSDPRTPKGQPEAAKALGAAHARLPYDLGLAMPAEAAWLADNGAALPSSFRVAGPHPASGTLLAGQVRVGVVLFPVLPTDAAKAPPDLGREVAEAARALRGSTDLVVGISPWGATAEADFLDIHGQTVDLLLGAGPGPGFPARPMAEDKVLWARPYSQGKSLLQIAVKSLPRRTPDWKWVREGNAAVLLQSLTENITNDPDMAALLAGFHLEQTTN